MARRVLPIVSKVVNALIVAALAAGAVLAFAGSHTPRWAPAPTPPRWEAPQATQPGRASGVPAAGGWAGPMARSLPATIDIPRIRVRAKIISLGLTAAGGPAVPPLTRPFLTSWYDKGPTPGQPGTAVIFGHVDAAGVGPAVFYELGDLRPGDLIYITLADRRTAVFRVYSAALYRKADFPAAAVYGYTSWPSLRLVTCGGQFDTATRHYTSNIVVFAQFVDQRPAR